MKITFSEGIAIDQAPEGYVRVRLTQEEKGTKRFVREGNIEWLEIGCGKPEEMNNRKFIRLIRSIVNAAKEQKAKKVAVSFEATPELWKNLSFATPEEPSRIFAENVEMANFEFRTLKTVPDGGWTELEEILVCDAATPAMQESVRRGQMIGQAVNAARELSNLPGGHLAPRGLANAAKEAVAGLPVTVTTLGREEIVQLGMGLLAGVGAGSQEEPTFTVLEYKGGAEGEAPIVLAGKGITFDSGGLNIKPSKHIYEMHLDMSGAAAVLHALALAAKLQVPKNVIALIPAAENLVGSNATRPGDIHRSLSGKTVEVTDTDAEGRLILADALAYAKRFNPSVVVDVATLTGSVMSALGLYASGLFTRENSLAETMLALGEASGDYLWRLPLWDEYEAATKSDFADLVNYSLETAGRYGDACNAAMFLWQFAKDLGCPWAHIDMAPRMTTAPGDELAKGAAGEPVRLLFSFIESWKP